MNKKVSDGKAYARKEAYEWEGTKYEADLKSGDIVTILSEGMVAPNKYGGESTEFVIKTRNGEKKLAFNQATINVLIDEISDDSKDWIDKEVNVILKKDIIAGKKVVIPYLVTAGWSLDEYGELVKEGSQETKTPTEEINWD